MNSLGFLIGSLPYVSPIFHGFSSFFPQVLLQRPGLDRPPPRQRQGAVATEPADRAVASAWGLPSVNSRGSRGSLGTQLEPLRAKTLSPNDSWDVFGIKIRFVNKEWDKT